MIEHLQPDGSHAPVEESRFLHITADEILDWLTAQDISREGDRYHRLNERAMGRDRQPDIKRATDASPRPRSPGPADRQPSGLRCLASGPDVEPAVS